MNTNLYTKKKEFIMTELKVKGVDDVYIEYFNTGNHDLAKVYLRTEVDHYIEELEEKRKKEIEAAKKAEEERKRKEKAAKAKKGKGGKPEKEEKVVKKPQVAVTTPVTGPKCMPLKGEVISQYGLQEHPVLHIATRNLGVEIRGKRGAAIRAAAAGTVVMVAEIDGRGPSVIIEHEGGTYSVYGHLQSIRVQEGKTVQNCEEIGIVGDIASLNGIKLYFQVSEGTQTVDPLEWLKQK